MGYTHYWRRPTTIPTTAFRAIRHDLSRLLPVLTGLGITLRGPPGDGEVELTGEVIAFNGDRTCGHPQRDLGITWPSVRASGVALLEDTGPSGTWCGGAELCLRTCDGDCSHERLWFPRVLEVSSWMTPDGHGRFLACCKTAFKPYDVAVTAFLVIAWHHLGPQLAVTSDGEMQHWQDATRLCDAVLGYGRQFRLGDGER